MAETRRSPSPEPCCLPNEILTSQAGLSWTIETTHHTNCPTQAQEPTK